MMDAERQREIRMRDEEIRRLKEEVGALKDRYQAAVILFKAPFALGVAMGAAAVGVIVLLIH